MAGVPPKPTTDHLNLITEPTIRHDLSQNFCQLRFGEVGVDFDQKPEITQFAIAFRKWLFR